MSLQSAINKKRLAVISLMLLMLAIAFGYHFWTNAVKFSEKQVQTIVAKEVGKEKLTYAYLSLSRKETKPQYHIKAIAGNEVYILSVDADSGKVLSTENQLITESEEAITTKGGYKCNCRPHYPRATAIISEKEARAIAEKETKHTPVVYTRFQLIQAIDNVDKPLYYEVQAYAGDTQYDLHIDAITGNILDYWTEKSREYRTPFSFFKKRKIFLPSSS